AAFLAAPSGPRDERRVALDHLVRRRDEAERALRRRRVERGAAPREVTLDAVAGALAPHEAVVAYRIAEERLHAHVVLHDGTLSHLVLADLATVDAAVRRFRAGIQLDLPGAGAPAEEEIDLRAAGEALREHVLDP